MKRCVFLLGLVAACGSQSDGSKAASDKPAPDGKKSGSCDVVDQQQCYELVDADADLPAKLCGANQFVELTQCPLGDDVLGRCSGKASILYYYSGDNRWTRDSAAADCAKQADSHFEALTK